MHIIDCWSKIKITEKEIIWLTLYLGVSSLIQLRGDVYTHDTKKQLILESRNQPDWKIH